MKKFLLLCVAAATAMNAGAQTDYHGFNIDASQALIDNQLRGALDKEVYRIGKALTMQVLYQPEYRHTQANPDLTAFEYGTTTASVKNKFADLTKADATQTQAALEAGTVDGFLVKATMDANGLAYVTVPEQYYKGGSLVDTPAEGGDFRVRFVMESADKGRINDLDEMHCDDITGVYVTIDAPATVTIENDFVQANTSTKFDGTNATGTTDQLFDAGTYRNTCFGYQLNTVFCNSRNRRCVDHFRVYRHLYSFEYVTSCQVDSSSHLERQFDVGFRCRY